MLAQLACQQVWTFLFLGTFAYLERQSVELSSRNPFKNATSTTKDPKESGTCHACDGQKLQGDPEITPTDEQPQRSETSNKAFECHHRGYRKSYSKQSHLPGHMSKRTYSGSNCCRQMLTSPDDMRPRYYCDFNGCDCAFVREDLCQNHRLGQKKAHSLLLPIPYHVIPLNHQPPLL